MKKILVIGASGSIGINVLKYLLSEGKYEITAMDLKNKKTVKLLKKYRRRVNIVYGDINDYILIEALVKGHDVIINLASVMPPMGDFYNDLSYLTEYSGTENIIKAINYYNKDVHLIYASTTSISNEDKINVKSKVKEEYIGNFAKNKLATEKLIKDRLQKYTILRIPLVLNEIKKSTFIYNVKKDSVVEVTTSIDAAYAFVKCIDYLEKINKKVFNVGMGNEGRILYNEILFNILKYQGISMKYILSRTFLEKNYYSPILLDSDDLDNIIHYRNDSLYNYYNRIKRRSKRKVLARFLAKPFVYFKGKRIR